MSSSRRLGRMSVSEHQGLLKRHFAGHRSGTTIHTFDERRFLYGPEQLRGRPFRPADIFALGRDPLATLHRSPAFPTQLQDLRLTIPRRVQTLPSQLNLNCRVMVLVILRAWPDDPAQRYAEADQLWAALKLSPEHLRNSDRARPTLEAFQLP